MKRRIKRIMATVIAVLVMVPMFTFSGYAAFGGIESAVPYAGGNNNYFYFIDQTTCEGYEYALWEESHGYPASSVPFSRAFMEFNPMAGCNITKELNYTVNNRIDYGFYDQDFRSVTFEMLLEPRMDTFYGGDEGICVDIYYDLEHLEYCYYIFGTANLDLGVILAKKVYYEDDFHIYD